MRNTIVLNTPPQAGRICSWILQLNSKLNQGNKTGI